MKPDLLLLIIDVEILAFKQIMQSDPEVAADTVYLIRQFSVMKVL